MVYPYHVPSSGGRAWAELGPSLCRTLVRIGTPTQLSFLVMRSIGKSSTWQKSSCNRCCCFDVMKFNITYSVQSRLCSTISSTLPLQRLSTTGISPSKTRSQIAYPGLPTTLRKCFKFLLFFFILLLPSQGGINMWDPQRSFKVTFSLEFRLICCTIVIHN